MGDILHAIFFALLVTGISSIEYHINADEEYRSINEEQPLISYKSAEHTELDQKIRITREGSTGLLFEVERSSNEALFIFKLGGFVVTSFKFEFESHVTRLTIRLDTVEKSFQTLQVESKVFSWPKLKSLQSHAETHAVHIRPPATVDQIKALLNLYTKVEKKATLSLDWIKDVLGPDHLILSEDNDIPGTWICISKPIVTDDQVIENLFKLKEHMKPRF